MDDELTPEEQAEIAAAQQREEDPDGDPDAQDLGAAEPESDTDPEPVLPPSADDDFSDLEEGEDDGLDDDLEADDGDA